VLRPQDLGVLSSVGVRDLPVFSRPRVRLVVTGNELLPSGSRPEGYRILDANGPCSRPSSNVTAVSSTFPAWCLTNPV
jgi:molybdopterin biosynthesis enzyme